MTMPEQQEQPDASSTSLADITTATLLNPRKGLIGYQDSKPARHAVARFRQQILEAQKFEMTPELIKIVTLVASTIQPEALLAMAKNARPCFDQMWIEWDEQERRAASIEITSTFQEMLPEGNKPPLLPPEYTAPGYRPHRIPGLKESSTAAGFSDRTGYLIRNINHVDLLFRQSMMDKAGEDIFFYTSVNFWANGSNQLTRAMKFDLPRNSVIVSPAGYIFTNEQIFQTKENFFAIFNGLDEDYQALWNDSSYSTETFIDEYLSLVPWDFMSDWVPSDEDSLLRSRAMTLTVSQAFMLRTVLGTNWWDIHNLSSDVRGGLLQRYWFCDTEALTWMRGLDGYEQDSQLVGDSRILLADDLRFLITAFLMLNSNWLDADPVRRSGNKLILRGRAVPRNEHKQLRIGITPKEIERKLTTLVVKQRLPSREHDVRGHSRKLASGKRIWIRPHKRGNAALGVIYKDYLLDDGRNKEGRD